MKANELMIGDWIIVHEEGHTYPQKKPFSRVIKVQVNEIGISHIGYACFLNNVINFTYTTMSKVEPIPLTPEILEKNGFEYKEGKTGMFGVTTASHYLCKGVPFEVFCDGEPFAIWFKEPVDIKFVHQLQHALRLCEIEKEIEL